MAAIATGDSAINNGKEDISSKKKYKWHMNFFPRELGSYPGAYDSTDFHMLPDVTFFLTGAYKDFIWRFHMPQDMTLFPMETYENFHMLPVPGFDTLQVPVLQEALLYDNVLDWRYLK